MRHLAFLLLPFLLATPLAAEPSVDVAKKDETAPSFYIEEILVEGNRHVSSGIVVAESLLRTGSSYTEDKLREAIYRIKRLPFLLGVDFELRKGSERDRYILVISVLETTRFFYAFDQRWSHLVDSPDHVPSRYRSDHTGDFLAGYRYFVGNQGLIYLTAGDIGLQFGYSSYNFLNRNVFLNVSWERDVFCCDDPESPGGDFQVLVDGDVDTFRFSVGIPRSARELWRVAAVHRRHDGDFRVNDGGIEVQVSNQDLRSTELQFAWIYDTTDDPVFPRRGDELTASVDLLDQDSRITDFFTPPTTLEREESRTRNRTRSATATLSGRRHYPIGRRQSLQAGFRVGAVTTDLEVELDANELFNSRAHGWAGEVSLFYTVDLLGAKRYQPQRRLRWENGVEYVYSRSLIDSRPDREFNQATLRSDLVYRSRWGVVRFSLSFIDVLERT